MYFGLFFFSGILLVIFQKGKIQQIIENYKAGAFDLFISHIAAISLSIIIWVLAAGIPVKLRLINAQTWMFALLLSGIAGGYYLTPPCLKFFCKKQAKSKNKKE